MKFNKILIKSIYSLKNSDKSTLRVFDIKNKCSKLKCSLKLHSSKYRREKNERTLFKKTTKTFNFIHRTSRKYTTLLNIQ